MSKFWRVALVVAMSATLPGCKIIFPKWHQNWQEVGRRTVIDPVTGDMTRTFTWRYEDGHITETTDVIRKGEDTDRRREVRPTPPVRESD